MRKLTAAAAAAMAALTLSQGALGADEILIGSTSTSSSHYSYFVAVNQVINDYAEGINAAVVETGATVDNLRRLSRRQVDLGLVTTNVGYHAYKGTGAFDGHAVDSRLLWVYTVAPQNVVVRKDSGIRTLAGLDGRRLNPGITGSATEKTTEAVMHTLGISPDYVRGSTSGIVSAIKDNRLNGYVKSGVGDRLDGSSLDIATFTPIRVLSLTRGQQRTLRAEMPDIGVMDVPAGAAEGIPAYTTWAFGVAVHARPGLSDEAAYRIVKAVMEHRGPQANAFKPLQGANLGAMTMDYGTVPLHPGAARYYRQQGIDIPERLQPR